MGTSIPGFHKLLTSKFPESRRDAGSLELGKMESELQSQIPGLDQIITEYSVVCLSAHMRGGGLDCECVEADYLTGLPDPCCKPLRRRCQWRVPLVRGCRLRDRAPSLRFWRFLPAKLRSDRQLGYEVHHHAELFRWRSGAETNALQGEEA